VTVFRRQGDERQGVLAVETNDDNTRRYFDLLVLVFISIIGMLSNARYGSA